MFFINSSNKEINEKFLLGKAKLTFYILQILKFYKPFLQQNLYQRSIYNPVEHLQ